MKNYLVFGANGSIGKEIVSQLNVHGNLVIASTRGKNEELLEKGVLVDVIEDVSNRETLETYSRHLSALYNNFDGIVYSVGHCPPNGFPDAIRYPLSQLPLQKYMDEVNMHQIGVLNVFQCTIKNLKDGGSFVFISSAITRLKGQFPAFLQAHHHASVISAEDWLIDGMRHDPTVTNRKIKIHRIAPAAVSTSFHESGPKPPKLIPVETVVHEVLDALESETVVDKQLL